MSEQPSEEKTDPASDKKLRDLRKKGIIATAPTGSDYVAFLAGLITSFILLGYMVRRLGLAFDSAFEEMLSPHTGNEVGALQRFLIEVNLPLLWIMIAAIAAGLLFKLLSQKGFVFAMERVQPRLDNVNPMNGLKKLVKGETLTNLAASATRFFVLILVVGLVGYVWTPTLLRLDLCVPGCTLPTVRAIVAAILIAVILLILISIIFDIIVQNAFFLLENRMTKTEVKRERKEMLGQPEVRQERRRLGREMVDGAEAVGSRKAVIYFFHGEDVVAFSFHPLRQPLPKLAARARGREAAMLLRAQLEEAGVPGFHHQEIVQSSITGALGESCKREIFMPLAGHLRTLFF